MKTFVFVTLLSLSSICLGQNQKDSYFIEFVVDGESSVELYKKINQEFRENPDFQVTRFDIPTERFFGVLKPEQNLDLVWFEKKFESYGLKIHCLNYGKLGEVPYQHMSKKDCTEITK